MKAISYTSARNNLAQTMQSVCDDHDPVIIGLKLRSKKPAKYFNPNNSNTAAAPVLG